MAAQGVRFSLFTKAWPKLPLPELAELAHALEFDGVELTVRPGYQVTPDGIATGLAAAVKVFAEHGVRIFSVAGNADEPTFAACAEAGIPLVRIMADVGREPYMAAQARWQTRLDALVPLLEKHRVTLGVQNHCDRYVGNACGLRLLLGKYDPNVIGAVWDPAHEAIVGQGQDPDMALDVVWSMLRMVNLKNAVWQRTNPDAPPAEPAKWRHHWLNGTQGLASWPRVAAELKRRGYAGVVTLSAEYTDMAKLDPFLREDIRFARSVFA